MHGEMTDMGRRVALAGALLVLLLGVSAVLTGGDDDEGAATQTSTELADEGTAAADVGRSAAGGAAADAASADASAVAPTASGATAADLSLDSAKVVRTGSVQVEVPKGAYAAAVGALTTKVAGMGGYVAESSSSEDQSRPSGVLVLRVPGDRFDDLLGEVRGTGEVRSEDTKATDVSAQSTDLAARLASAKGTRARFEAVLAQADAVDEILSVQDRIGQVQTQIEQLEGQLRLLDDQVALASLTVQLGEPGAELATYDDGERDLGGAWDDARERFGDGLESIVAGSGPAALLLLVAGVGYGAWRIAEPRVRRRATARTTAADG